MEGPIDVNERTERLLSALRVSIARRNSALGLRSPRDIKKASGALLRRVTQEVEQEINDYFAEVGLTCLEDLFPVVGKCVETIERNVEYKTFISCLVLCEGFHNDIIAFAGRVCASMT